MMLSDVEQQQLLERLRQAGQPVAFAELPAAGLPGRSRVPNLS